MIDSLGDAVRVERLFLGEVDRQFLSMGDQDYISARQAYWNKLSYPFVWLAGQAIEKHLKASLLVRREKIKKNHDLVWHFNKLNSLQSFEKKELLLPILDSEELFSEGFILPSFDEWKYNSNTNDYINKLNIMYDPSIRYGTRSYEIETNDLFKLDQIIFHLRNDFISFSDRPTNYDISAIQFGEVDLRRLGENSVVCLKMANQLFYPSFNTVDFNLGIILHVHNQDWRDTRVNYDPDWPKAIELLTELITK